jgi:hypothetical protein
MAAHAACKVGRSDLRSTGSLAGAARSMTLADRFLQDAHYKPARPSLCTKCSASRAWRLRSGAALLSQLPIAAHLLMLWLPFVNEERAFNSAAEFFRSSKVAAI